MRAFVYKSIKYDFLILAMATLYSLINKVKQSTVVPDFGWIGNSDRQSGLPLTMVTVY